MDHTARSSSDPDHDRRDPDHDRRSSTMDVDTDHDRRTTDESDDANYVTDDGDGTESDASSDADNPAIPARSASYLSGLLRSVFANRPAFAQLLAGNTHDDDDHDTEEDTDDADADADVDDDTHMPLAHALVHATARMQAANAAMGRQLLASSELSAVSNPLFVEAGTVAWTRGRNLVDKVGDEDQMRVEPPSNRDEGVSVVEPGPPLQQRTPPTSPQHHPDAPMPHVALLRGRELMGPTWAQPSWFKSKGHFHLPSAREGHVAARYRARPYSGQFSVDGRFFYACTQDFLVHLYDSTDPERLIKYKTARGQVGQWTITDATLSPDNQFLAYSSISPIVHLARTDRDDDTQVLLNFDRDRRIMQRFGIWSLRFSSDGRELVAGTSNNGVYVFDVETRQTVLAARGHTDDVNAVCFADQGTNVLYSGSDDSLIKVWDRRSLRSSGGTGAAARPEGVLVGHTEGITYLSSRGDGRHLVSNSKDQSAKLWDVRRMVTPTAFDSRGLARRDRRLDWDYRYERYPAHPATHRHPDDVSLVTFTGHAVLATLIRCHFHPTDTRYIATGSRDGLVRVYNLLGECVRVLDTRSAAAAAARRGGDEESEEWSDDDVPDGWRRDHVVRDVAWHPSAPVLLATAWTPRGGCIVRHQYAPASMQGSGESVVVDA
ncbi:hypothetical protein AMAG_13439 [Allomyces macrogynus ATCC 38327]|uniref:Uncharacterized protein n=1 Tax=Allomyces macrogynus (strain ATCC 38327) TaxID=578462 RepID=A0A0L0T1S7_ALLM3|nr:hypothetical protein AMAG_13439 [Allomyces macrogynus ATCC 38327]|eukprot:KNE68798.1 hypothetical protein AMAG_13439 [Allomyces macrogynus ATCC 38327]